MVVRETNSKKMKRKEYEKHLRKLRPSFAGCRIGSRPKEQESLFYLRGVTRPAKVGRSRRSRTGQSRVFRVVALPAPSDREKSQMHIQRYMAHFPAAGEIVIFDRSGTTARASNT